MVERERSAANSVMRIVPTLLAVVFLTAGCGPCSVGAESLDALPTCSFWASERFCAIFGYYIVRDGFRFGTTGMPWAVAAIGSAVFLGAGLLFAGPAGTAAGAPFLLAFGLGKVSQTT